MKTFFVRFHRNDIVKKLTLVLLAAFLLQATSVSETHAARSDFWEEFMDTVPLGSGGTFIAVQGNETLFQRDFGSIVPGSDEPVDRNTFFMGGTLGESIIAALAMDLHEQGKLNLSEEVVNIIHDLPFDFTILERNITVEDLLTHPLKFSTFHGASR